MIVVITGVPGTGKTSAAKSLAIKTKAQIINEKTFCIKNRLGKPDKKTGEYVVDLKRLEKALNMELSKNKNVIVEGHLLCDIKLMADTIVVLSASEKDIQKRLEKRGYSDEKILDNRFAQTTGYCINHAKKNYGKKKIVEVFSSKSIKETTSIILKELKKRAKKA